MADIHAERREPAPPDGPLDLDAAGNDLLDEAAAMSSGRAARTLTPGVHAPLKQTLVALRAGTHLSEHDMNGPATIHLLRGAVTVETADARTEVAAGQWTAVPPERHSVRTSEDSLLLVTVAPTAEPPSRGA